MQKKPFHPSNKDQKLAEAKPSSSKAGSSKSGESCVYCKRPGHLIGDCKKRKAEEEYLKSTFDSTPIW